MCEQCEGWCHKALVDTGTLQAFVTTDSKLYVEYHGTYDQECYEAPIDYCPKCGRNLKEESHG